MEIRLTHGIWRSGICHRTAWIRSTRGSDEAFLLELPPSLVPARRVSALLERLVERIGGINEPVAGLVRELTIGDRERILTVLCRLLLGDQIDVTVRCPNPGCGALTETVVSLDAMLATRAPDHAHEIQEAKCVDDSGRAMHVAFRLPNGGHEELIAALAMQDPTAAADRLFDETILSVTDSTGQPIDSTACRAVIRQAVEAAVQELDPALDRHTEISCQSCGRSVLAEFDAATILVNALTAGGDIFRQVDRLARTYHWTESDILSLTSARRHLYLRLAESTGAPS